MPAQEEWEHIIVELSDVLDRAMSALNEKGEQGWELVAILLDNRMRMQVGDNPHRFAYMKRRKQ